MSDDGYLSGLLEHMTPEDIQFLGELVSHVCQVGNGQVLIHVTNHKVSHMIAPVSFRRPANGHWHSDDQVQMYLRLTRGQSR